jgi:hypothetical protein
VNAGGRPMLTWRCQRAGAFIHGRHGTRTIRADSIVEDTSAARWTCLKQRTCPHFFPGLLTAHSQHSIGGPFLHLATAIPSGMCRLSCPRRASCASRGAPLGTWTENAPVPCQSFRGRWLSWLDDIHDDHSSLPAPLASCALVAARIPRAAATGVPRAGR